MTTFRGENAAFAYLQVTGKLTYTVGATVDREEGALFKVIADVTGKNVTLTYLDGSTDTDIDAQIASDMNPIVKKVEAGSAPLLAADFGLYI
jgi:hypothetical protein